MRSSTRPTGRPTWTAAVSSNTRAPTSRSSPKSGRASPKNSTRPPPPPRRRRPRPVEMPGRFERIRIPYDEKESGHESSEAVSTLAAGAGVPAPATGSRVGVRLLFERGRLLRRLQQTQSIRAQPPGAGALQRDGASVSDRGGHGG